MNDVLVPKVGAFVNRPGKGNNKGFTAALRELSVGAHATIQAKPAVAAALATKLWGAGNYAVRAMPRGCRVYRTG